MRAAGDPGGALFFALGVGFVLRFCSVKTRRKLDVSTGDARIAAAIDDFTDRLLRISPCAAEIRRFLQPAPAGSACCPKLLLCEFRFQHQRLGQFFEISPAGDFGGAEAFEMRRDPLNIEQLKPGFRKNLMQCDERNF